MENNTQFFTKVRGLFSRFKKLKVAYAMSKEVKVTRKKLDQVADDATKFGFVQVDCQPIRKREETYAYVNENRIVGREVDKKRIVAMLLDPNIQEDAPVLAIVGMGGLGKTTLAQLVYNDERVQTEFQNRRFWVCVSDQDQKCFDTKAILAAIYKIATGQRNADEFDFHRLVQALRNILDQNKYLLFLDDLWTEDRMVCNELMDILIGSGQMVKRGSRIVVTTRSKKTATVMSCSHLYDLGGLSDENSWQLFKITSGIESTNRHDLVGIGKEIVKKCANVPPAIKVIGSFLYGQDKNTWLCIRQRGLSAIRKEENDIMPILKFSYYHLSPSLKTCFAYCAMFPKDFELQKEKLISLWMAHDYVKDEGQGIEATAEYNFNILVQRCFFLDVSTDYKGLATFKIHDLMHDMAQQVAGKDIFIANSSSSKLDEKSHHVYDDAPNICTVGFMTRSKIRSYVKNEVTPLFQFPVYKLLANWRSLRVLDLSKLGMTDLPNAIGELLHLRWLDLSFNQKLKMLPEALIKLINLQFLDLHGCANLEELPKDFSKLINLRTLFLGSLTHMPLGMEKMTCLTRLNYFTVGQKRSSAKNEVRLDAVRAPKNLRGSLKIYIMPKCKRAIKDGGEGGYLCNTEHLEYISIEYVYKEHDDEGEGDDENMLEDLQPHSNLNELEIEDYRGLRFPRWAREDGLKTCLPNLVKIVLLNFGRLTELPWLSRLRHLKTLQLWGLLNLELMENKTSIDTSSDGAAAHIASNSSTAVEIVESSIFFPSLEELDFNNLPKLKGWWRGSSISTSGCEIRDDEMVNRDSSMQFSGGQRLPLFPCLSQVSITDCPNLRSVPLGPAVQTLKFFDPNKRSCFTAEEEEHGLVGSSSGNDSGSSRSYDPKVKEVETTNVRFLQSLPTVAFQCVTKMEIERDNVVENLSEVEEVFCSCSSSLRSLNLALCANLKSVSGGLQHLTTLESLELFGLSKLTFEETGREDEDEDGEGLPWRCLAQSLTSLKLGWLEKVVELPKGMRYLTALQSLKIEHLSLTDLPEWTGCLSSLQSLQIEECRLQSLPEAMTKLTTLTQLRISSYDLILETRCRHPDGEDWPKIRHIHSAHISTFYFA